MSARQSAYVLQTSPGASPTANIAGAQALASYEPAGLHGERRLDEQVVGRPVVLVLGSAERLGVDPLVPEVREGLPRGVSLFGEKAAKPTPCWPAMASAPSVSMNSGRTQPVSPIQFVERPASAACRMSVADSTEPAWTMTAPGASPAIRSTSAR